MKQSNLDKFAKKRHAHISANLELYYQPGFVLRGCIMALFGVFAPVILPARLFNIYASLNEALLGSNSQLIVAALKLECLNVMRMIPHYLGAFMITESIEVWYRGKRRFVFNILLTFALIVSIYELIFALFGIRYDFGYPAILTVTALLIFSYLNLFSVQMRSKGLILGGCLLSIQWLDMIPALSKHGFGRGEISMDVKVAAVVTENELLLTIFSACMFAAFLYAFIIQTELLRNQHLLKISNEKSLEMEHELHQAQINALKMRNITEVQSLVHDLKTPLTTVNGLISLAQMMEKDKLILEYFDKITIALSNMNVMISEILYEEKRTPIETEYMMKVVLAHTSIFVPVGMVTYENSCPNAVIMGNRVRLTRAIMNLIHNSFDAVDKKEGKINVRVCRVGSEIEISVADNGVGIERDDLGEIWNLGYSGRRSTGLGLVFTKEVIEKHGGTIQIDSKKGVGTKACIRLKEAANQNE